MINRWRNIRLSKSKIGIQVFTLNIAYMHKYCIIQKFENPTEFNLTIDLWTSTFYQRLPSIFMDHGWFMNSDVYLILKYWPSFFSWTKCQLVLILIHSINMVEQLYVILLPNALGKKPDSKPITPWLKTHPLTQVKSTNSHCDPFGGSQIWFQKTKSSNFEK